MSSTQDLGRARHENRLQSAALRADVIRVASQVARTHDQLARTLERLAGQYPHDAARLRAQVDAAEAIAARTRHLASELAGHPVGSDQPA